MWALPLLLLISPGGEYHDSMLESADSCFAILSLFVDCHPLLGVVQASAVFFMSHTVNHP